MSDEKTIINVWLADYPFVTYAGQPFLDPMRARAEEFNKTHPDYHVNIQGFYFWTMADEVRRAVELGNPPDVVGYYTTDTQVARDTMTKSGRPLFTSVERAIGGRTEILGEPVVLGDVVAAVRDCYTYQGEVWSMPVTATATVLYANLTLLERAGIAQTPQTWQEVEEAGRAVRALAGGPSHTITWANHGWLFLQALAQQGGLLVDNDNGRSGRALTATVDSPQMLAWVRWWQRLHADGHYFYSGSLGDWDGSLGAFVAQRVAFMIDSSKSAEEITRAGADAGFQVGVGQTPYNSQASYAGGMIAGDSLWLADGLDPRTRDGALAFTQFVANPANAAAWHKSNGFVPVTRASFALLEREGWFDLRPHQRVAVDQLKRSTSTAAALGALAGNFDQIQDLLTQAMEDVLIRAADPAVRFALANDEAQRLLDSYNSNHHRYRSLK